MGGETFEEHYGESAMAAILFDVLTHFAFFFVFAPFVIGVVPIAVMQFINNILASEKK